jgi:hypothetical protein
MAQFKSLDSRYGTKGLPLIFGKVAKVLESGTEKERQEIAGWLRREITEIQEGDGVETLTLRMEEGELVVGFLA